MACRVDKLIEPSISGVHDVFSLDQRLVTSDDVSIFPGRHWDLSEDTADWTFRGEARAAVWVQAETSTPLYIDFETAGATDRFHFVFAWDDTPLEMAGRVFADGGGTLKIEGAALTEGVHILKMTREGWKDSPEDRQLHDNEFRSLAYRHGTLTSALRADDHERLRFIGTQLELGVAGSTINKRSGCLFDGPRTFVVNLLFAKAGELRFAVENESTMGAHFRLSRDDVSSELSVDKGQGGSLALAVKAGTTTIRFEVSGDEDGLFLWGGSSFTPDDEVAATPIVLLTLDTTRRDALSIYGGLAEASPRLHSFAEKATVFDNAFATSPWTLPSHASMMTGLYPSMHMAGVTSDWIAPQHVTLASLLRTGGYYNAGFAGGEMCASRWGVARSFQFYQDPDGFESRGDVLNEGVFRVLETIGSDPLFLFVNYFDPHGLYRAPERFQEIFDVARKEARLEGQQIWKDLAKGDGAAWRAIIDGKGEPTPEALDYLRAAYLAEVAFMDEQIGLLFDELERQGLFDSALIVVVADHGEFLGEGGMFSHACRLDPELVEVPLIIKWPHQKQGERSQLLVSHVDLFSTVLRAAGIEAPANDGIRIDQFENPEILKRETVFMEEHESRIHPLYDSMRIAPHLFGLQQILRREVVWEGGHDCSSRQVDGGWASIRCESSWEESLAQIGTMAEIMNERRREAQAGALSKDERLRLEALGYIN